MITNKDIDTKLNIINMNLSALHMEVVSLDHKLCRILTEESSDKIEPINESKKILTINVPRMCNIPISNLFVEYSQDKHEYSIIQNGKIILTFPDLRKDE